RRAVQTFAYRMVGERSEAEDLTQEVFLRAHRSLSQVGRDREETRFANWLRTITRNHCLNYINRRARRNRIEVPLPEDMPPDVRDPAPGVRERMEEHELHRLLHAALATLSEDERQVITLRLEGLSYEEIADEFPGANPTTLRGQYRRGWMK